MKKKTPYQRTRYKVNCNWAVVNTFAGNECIFQHTISHTIADAKKSMCEGFDPGSKWASWDHWQAEGYRVERIEMKVVK